MEGRGHRGVGADIGLVELENLLDSAAETQRKLPPDQSGGPPPPSSPHRPNTHCGRLAAKGGITTIAPSCLSPRQCNTPAVFAFASLGKRRVVDQEPLPLALPTNIRLAAPATDVLAASAPEARIRYTTPILPNTISEHKASRAWGSREGLKDEQGHCSQPRPSA